MEANVTVGGPALDVQHFVGLVEDRPAGGPVDGSPGTWKWVSEREDVLDRVIAHSMEFPDVECEVEGYSVADGDFREDIWAWVVNGNGIYERTVMGDRNRRLPADLVFTTIRYEFRLTAGKAALTRAVVQTDTGSLDVTHYLR